jgi:hypothetical protein
MAYGGKVQVGLNGIQVSRFYRPFIDIWKCSGALEVKTGVSGETTLSSNNAPGVANSPWDDYLDQATGELVNPLPSDFHSLVRLINSVPQDSAALPDDALGGTAWVLTFEGTASTITQHLASLNIQRTGNRLEWTWPAGGGGNFGFSFAGVDLEDPPVNIKIFRADQEALLDAGEIFDPGYIAKVRRMSGIVRFMDWLSVNSNRNARTVADIPSSSYYTFTEVQRNPLLKTGVSLAYCSAFANRIWSHPWVCIPAVLGTEKTVQIASVTAASPPVVTTTGTNPFVNGDEIIPYSFSGMIKTATVTMTIASPCVVTWTAHGMPENHGVRFSGGTFPTGITAGTTYYIKSVATDTFEISATPGGASINTSGSQSGTHTGTQELVRNTYTVANADADSFELNVGANAANATGYSAGSAGYATSPYDLARITTEVTLYATHFRDNVRSGLVTYYEFGNEQWNAIFDGFHWAAAQARSKFAGDDSFRMTGYLAAHCMAAVRDVYGEANRSRWKGVLATQTVASTGVTNGLIAGVNQYLSENPTLSFTDLFDHGAVTSYYGGSAYSLAVADDLRDLREESELRFNQGSEPTKYAYYDRTINAEVMATELAFYPAVWAAQKAAFDAVGLSLIQYEGGQVADLTDLTGQADYADFLEWFKATTKTAADAETQIALYELWEAYGTYPSKFVDIVPVSRFGAFGALDSNDDETAVYDAIVDYNDTPRPIRMQLNWA